MLEIILNKLFLFFRE